MRLNSVPYDITVIYVTYFQIHCSTIIKQCAANRAPINEVCRMWFYISHIMKYVSSSAAEQLLCNSQILCASINSMNSCSVIFYVFVLSCVCYVLCASVYMCFAVTCWERADLLALVCGVFCEFVTFPLVSWVRCGTWLYRFLIFAPLLT